MNDEQEKPKGEEVDIPQGAEQENAQEGQPKDEPSEDVGIDELTTLHERAIAALSYVGFLAIIPFYLKKDSKFCRFHGKQGMVLVIIFFFAKLFTVLDIIMDIMLILQAIIAFYMGFMAISGRWKKLPWIYKRACQLEETLSLKTKEEEEEEASLKPEEVKAEESK